MKKIFCLIIIVGFSFSSFAGEPINGKNNVLLSNKSDGEKCYDENTKIINIGVGFGSGGYFRYSGGKYTSSPAMSVSYEQPWPKKLGPGFLGVGAYVGFQTTHYRYDYNNYWGNYFYEERRSYYTVTGRATYHWDVLNSAKAEVYGGVLIGVRFRTYSYNDNDPNHDYKNAGSFAYPTGGGFVGARYYFAKNIGVYAEAGYGISYATVGLNIKF
ncbi:MAG: hypothetical protein NTX97_15520 [Bacteroidetes bacterium]|nr:hypothetical protein [Bacteroidota bacterium]